MTQEKIINDNTLFANFMNESVSFNYLKTQLPMQQFQLDGVIETAYHRDWNWIIPVFFKFCEVAEPLANIPRTRISFCSDFVAGLWQQDVKVCYKSLLDGIEWYNKFNDSSETLKQDSRC